MWVGLIIQIVSLIKFQTSKWIVDVAIYKRFSSSLIIFWEESNQIFIENSKKKKNHTRSILQKALKSVQQREVQAAGA